METLTKTEAFTEGELIEQTNLRQTFLFKPYPIAGIKFPESITYWEQVMCAGYNPQERRLEAVVNIKQQNGYSGNLCSVGSTEFVKFFIDFKDGSGFHDMGYTSFKVADIPNIHSATHPLSYMAYLYIDDAKYKKFLDCDHAVIPTLHVILSWNAVPNSNPNQHPYYGNVINVDIQLAKLFWLFPYNIAQLVKNDSLLSLLDANEPIKLKAPYTESTNIILAKNRKAGVPEHRTLYSSIGSLLNTKINFTKAASVFDLQELIQNNFDINKYLPYFNGDGKNADTTFEELTCVGLHTATDRLGAVIHIKKSSGFSGNLCTKGSNEHVAFWADWNNDGTFDQYLGTTSINVFDIANIPAGGLYYNVFLPIDVSKRLRLCNAPNIIRIRAVLSWESLPSATDPNHLNTWGNYRDALVQLRPVNNNDQGIHAAIEFVGSAARSLIHSSSVALENLYNFNTASPNAGNNRPWGGAVTFAGKIHRNGYNGAINYRILYKQFGALDSTYQTVSTSETFLLDNLNDFLPFYPSPQTAADGWFLYEENPATGIYNVNDLLATWNTGGLTDGTYTIQFVIKVSAIETIEDTFSVVICNQGMSISPTANTSVDTTYNMDLVIDGGDCHSYSSNDAIIHGHLHAIHPYFADFSLDLQPTSHSHGTSPVLTGISPDINSRSYSAYGDNGDNNREWTLDTTPLDPCGYTISLGAHTRVILNSYLGLPYYAPKAVGFAKLP